MEIGPHRFEMDLNIASGGVKATWRPEPVE